MLAVAGGAGVSGVARTLGVSRPTVIKWRERFAADGITGLADLPRSGRPKTIDDAHIIAATLEPPPPSLGVTHWSSRLLARHLGISDATVARAWRAYRVQPWRQGTFKFSTDPPTTSFLAPLVNELQPRHTKGGSPSRSYQRPVAGPAGGRRLPYGGVEPSPTSSAPRG